MWCCGAVSAIEAKPLPSQVIEQLQFDRLGIAAHLINDLCRLVDKVQSDTTSGLSAINVN